MKRTLSILLILALLIGCLAGCSKEKENDNGEETTSNGETETDATAAKYAYKAEFMPLSGPEGTELEYINAFCVSGEYLFYSAQYVSGEETSLDENGEPMLDENGDPIVYDIYEQGVFRLDPATGEVKTLDYTPSEVPEGMEGDAYLQGIMAGGDGSIWIQEELYTYTFDLPEDFDESTDDRWNYYVGGESKNSMTNYNADGENLGQLSLDVGEDYYLYEYFFDSKGNVYSSSWQEEFTVFKFDSTGAQVGKLGLGENGGNLVQLSQDEIGVTMYKEEGGYVLQLLDTETMTLGEELPMPSNAYNLYAGVGEYQYLYQVNDMVYGYLEETETSEKLFSWLDCDVNSNNIDQFQVLEDGRVIALERDWSSGTRETNLVTLHQVDASSLPQKDEIILACMYLDWELRTDIINFNRAHDDVRIVVRDYSEYNTEEDYNAGIQKLNTEILSGSAPDILALSGLPMDRYVAAGILEDLWPMIDNDPELSREDLMTHLFEVMSVDGKLYQVVDSFSIQTAVGSAGVVGDRIGWTLDELLEALDTLEDNATIFGESNTKSDILYNCVSSYSNSFIDWSTGQCDFENQQFIDLLNFANSFPMEFSYEDYDWETAESDYTRIKTGKQLLYQGYLYSFDEVRVVSAIFEGKPAYVGYPSAEGSGSWFQISSGLAITTACENKEAAWQLVRELLLEENQTEEYMYEFPTNRHSFETLVEQVMTPQYSTNPETGEQEEVSQGGIGWNDFMVDLYAMTQEEYEDFMAVYEACDRLYSYNDEIMQLISEECQPFFEGQKTAEETAAIIQNRVSLYVAEQM